MICINPKDPQFKKMQAEESNPLLAEVQYNKNVDMLSELAGQQMTSIQEGLNWLSKTMPNAPVQIVEGLVDNVAKGSFNELNGLITLSKEYADNKTIYHEGFHRAFSLLPKKEQENLLNEGSKQWGIERETKDESLAIEEKMAEWAESGLAPKNKFERLLRQIWEWFKSLVGVKNFKDLEKLARDIEGGRFKDKLVLNDILKQRLSTFGFTFISNKDSVSSVDVINKIVYYRWGESLDLSSSKAVLMLMGGQNVAVQELMKSINKWSGFKEIYDKYFPIYQNIEQVKFEAASHLISKHINKQFFNKEDKGLFQKILDYIKSFVKGLQKENIIALYELHSTTIASKILKNELDFSKFDIPYNYVKLSKNEAFKKDLFAGKIHDLVTQLGGSLTGSLAISSQSPIYRDIENPIHDLDFTVQKYSSAANIVSSLKKWGGIYLHSGIKGTKSYTASVLIPREGFEIVRFKRYDKGWKTGTVDSSSVVIKDIKNKKYYKYHESLVLAVDLFIREKVDTFKSDVRIDNIFEAKQSFSNSEIFFKRSKDEFDYFHMVINPEVEVETSSKYTYFNSPGDSVINSFKDEVQIYNNLNDIPQANLDIIYKNYVKLIASKRAGKELRFSTFEYTIQNMNVLKFKNTYIFGTYDFENNVFVTRLTSSPSSEELLANAISNIVLQKVDVIELVPEDIAAKLVRSGFVQSKNSFEYNFKGEIMQKFMVASSESVFQKVFQKNNNDVTSQEIKTYNEKISDIYKKQLREAIFVKNQNSVLLEDKEVDFCAIGGTPKSGIPF